ncbi:hypothetical protein RSOL_331780, partial [Rhizoctonia solani AG-3 Rhs1AP]
MGRSASSSSTGAKKRPLTVIYRNLRQDKGKLVSQARRKVVTPRPLPATPTPNDRANFDDLSQELGSSMQDQWFDLDLTDQEVMEAFENNGQSTAAPVDLCEEEYGGNTPNDYLHTWRSRFAGDYLMKIFKRNAAPSALMCLKSNNKRNTTGVRPQCDNHKAAADMFVKFAGLDVTGIAAVSCTRHTFFLPGGTVDFRKGEKFASIDYGVSTAILNIIKHGKLPFGMTYDVFCHWIPNFRARAALLPPHAALPTDLDLIGGVPKFHIIGHIQECKVRWSLNNMDNVGRIEGEGPERGWSGLNEASGSLSEKSPGFRHDSINYLMNSWNLEKTFRLATFLNKQFKDSKKAYVKQKVVFEDLNSCIPLRHRAKWQSISTKPTLIDGQWISPFEFKDEQGKKVQKVLFEERRGEANGISEPSKRTGAARWVLNAIELETFMCSVREEEEKNGPSASYHKLNSLNDKRQKLNDKLTTHRNQQEIFMSGLGEPDHPEKDPPATGEPEYTELGLPSSYLPATLQGCALHKLAALEGKFRRASCNEALHTLRELLGCKAVALKWKRQNISGETRTTRAEGALKEHQEKVNRAKAAYHRSWEALKRLNLDKGDAETYRELHSDDLKSLKHYLEIESAELGDGFREIPWIWRVGSIKNKDEWLIEALRVEWFRARQRARQWEEELILLKRDMLMALRSFEVNASRWQWKSQVADLELGMGEYAARQAQFYQKLKEGLFEKCDACIRDPIVILRWAEIHWPNSPTESSISFNTS